MVSTVSFIFFLLKFNTLIDFEWFSNLTLR